MTHRPDEDRAAGVHRRFKAARRDAMGRSFWEHWRTESCAFLVGMYSTVLILLLEPTLWSDGWLANGYTVRIPDEIAAALLVTIPFNGWLLDRFLSTKTSGEISQPRWILAFRWLAASLPLLGLYTISIWREILEREPARRVSRSSSLDLSRKRLRLPAGIRSRGLYRSGFFFVWAAGSLLPLAVWAAWLAQTMLLGAYRRAAISAFCMVLHVVASLSMAQYFRHELVSSTLKGWRRWLLSGAAICWLLAIPGVVMGFAMFLLADPPREGLTWAAHAGRTSVKREQLWRGNQGGLLRQWERKPWYRQWNRPVGLSPPEVRGETEGHIIAFRRLKALLLTVDGAALFAAAPSHMRKALFPGALWTTAALAGVGLLLQGGALTARLLRVPLAQSFGHHPYGRYLLLTQSAFLAGLYLASLWSVGQLQQMGLLLCLGGALCGVASVLFFFPPGAAPSQGPDMLLWGSLFLSVCAWGGLIALDGERGGSSWVVLETLTVLAPFWSLGLFLAFGGWQFRPYSWRHVFDRALPLRLRIALGFAGLTAALPLGGMAIPFWIYLRHRLWPRYERLPEVGYHQGDVP